MMVGRTVYLLPHFYAVAHKHIRSLAAFSRK